MSNNEGATMDVELTPEQKQAEEHLNRNVKFLERGIAASEIHYIHRALRTVLALRKRLQPEVLSEIIAAYTSASNQKTVAGCLDSILESLELRPAANPAAKVCEPEVCMYFGLLAQLLLLDAKAYERGARLSNVLVAMVSGTQRRTLDSVASRVYFYYSRFFEVAGHLSDARTPLLNALQTATLANMKETKAMLLTLLLRNYMHYKLYDQAERLAAKTTFPADAPNNLLARYLYYMGRIEAVQLNYSQAQLHLLEATRKAPSNATTAGFQQTVHKIYVIVELLMGNIPERSIFRVPILKKPLQPYFELTQAVRVGDLTQFQNVVRRYQEKFLEDQVLVLVQRLRHNVIKAGIRSISVAYSRISLRDICIKLHLDSEEDAEYIVAKAIRDGVIDATVDHEKGYVKSAENHNVYATSEPQHAFDRRITFCLNLYNDSVKSMRYPGGDHRKELANVDEAIKREREYAHELENEDFDDDVDGDAMDQDL
ncbi:26S proteasome non-ATPase regulatory subunit [Coemansia sp. RSA 1722]|nr:26S proteasome non-ATPase regulatory subunit [Coemansia sp. RSA 486]KAJ2237818.1 26S proteasome non-ATPase regulatory subunit [Coemansia sp. RSA 485]KAJ2603246.1 26S proteasome non-ATPase regulatory subunit [Coemansia sp. RSA 1721]KAJ2605875.1 26S proteasome non-ATPase regulatory subunit [Coemansia sp. RSA 1722]KAJ2639964.1 26S proteasome non-ATPase regulatory subunit [Coemansia sp. RSA 1286]